MNSRLITFSVVLLGEDHNPSLLNPDFLLRNSIIDSKWIIEEGQPFIITPIRTEFSFNNGIQFSLDQKRLIIKDFAPAGDYFPIPEIIKKYIKTLPHVNYRAIGINFETFYMFDNFNEAKSYQKNKYLKNGNWDFDNKLTEVSIKFLYQFDDSICNISFGPPIEILNGEVKEVGLILSGNFHRDFNNISSHDDVNKKVITIIDNWKTDQEIFKNLSNSIIGD